MGSRVFMEKEGVCTLLVCSQGGEREREERGERGGGGWHTIHLAMLLVGVQSKGWAEYMCARVVLSTLGKRKMCGRSTQPGVVPFFGL